MGYKTKLLVGFLLSFGVLFLTTCKKNSTGSDQPNQSPTVTFSITPTEGIMPHQVTVSVTGTDSDGSIASYHFDADGDGTAEITQSTPIDQSYTYENEGTYSAKAWVSDDEGADSSKQNVQVTVESDAPEITMTVTPTEGLEPLEVQVTITQTDPTGDFEYFEVDFGRGDGIEQITATQIDTSLTYDRSVTIIARGFDQAGNQSSEQTTEIAVTPTHQLTLKLRNLTQDGEPYVTEGETTFTIGQVDTTVSAGEITLNVPEGRIDVNAIHADYYDPWLIVKDESQGAFEKLEQRDTEDEHSPVDIIRDRILELYKIKRSDIESIENVKQRNGEDPFYSMEVVKINIDTDVVPPDGMDRFDFKKFEEQPLILWFDTEGSNTEGNERVEGVIERFFFGTGEDSWFYQSHGAIRPENIEIKRGGDKPDTPFFRVRYESEISGVGAQNGKTMYEDSNEIRKAIVNLSPDVVSNGALLSEILQATLITGDYGSGSTDDLQIDDKVSPYARMVGKIAYEMDLGTDF